MADFGIAEIAAIVSATTAVAGTAYTLSQGKPAMPATPQEAKSPTADAFRRKNAAAMLPGGALAGNSSTLGAGAGPSQNVGTSTLLGQ